jgi:hypothetical protein
MNAQQQASIRRAQQLRSCHLLCRWQWVGDGTCVEIVLPSTYVLPRRISTGWSLGLSALSLFREFPVYIRKIEESKNRSWVCPSPTFDFLTIIQTEIKKSKNRRIEESQIEVEVVTTDRRRSEFIYFSATVSNLLPPPPLLRLSSFHCVCEQITLLLRLLSPLKPSQTLT